MYVCKSFVCTYVCAYRRGRVLLPAFWDRLSEEACPEVEGLEMRDGYIEGKVKQAEGYFKEVRKLEGGKPPPPRAKQKSSLSRRAFTL